MVGQGFSRVAIYFGFMVKRIEMAGSTIHKQEDNVFRLGKVMRLFATSERVVGEQVREREAAEACAAACEEISARSGRFDVWSVSSRHT